MDCLPQPAARILSEQEVIYLDPCSKTVEFEILCGYIASLEGYNATFCKFQNRFQRAHFEADPIDQ